MAIKGILFDKDGTLVDFNATWSQIADRMALEAAGGRRARADELLALAGYDAAVKRFRADSVFAAGTNADVVALWYPDLSRQERQAKLEAFNRITAVEGAAMAVPISGIAETVAALHRAGMRLGIATNDSTAGAEQTLLALGIAQMFDAVFGYDAVANPKPAADPVIAFGDLTGLKPAEIAVVGDNLHDLDMAKRAGAGMAIGVLSGTGTCETLMPTADVILNSIADLPGLVLNYAGQE
jgi:phosphoglycolate phosphatase